MRNHFHLVIETPNANLVEGLRKETTVTVKAIAGLLHLGTPNSARVRLRHALAATDGTSSWQTALLGM